MGIHHALRRGLAKCHQLGACRRLGSERLRARVCVAVTLIAVVLLAWAGRRAGTDRSSGRRLLALLGGGLVVLVLVVVASALRRMALYEQYFGWTVLRLHVAAFEVWLAVVLVLCGLAWTVRGRRRQGVARAWWSGW